VAEEEVRRFLDNWMKSWTAAPDKPRLFHPDGGLLYPGEHQPYQPDEEGMRTDRLRSIAPDLQMRLLHWAERDGVVLGEWELRCTIGDRPLRLRGVNRFQLKGDRAVSGRAFLDRLELLEFLEPERKVVPLSDLLGEASRTVDPSPVADPRPTDSGEG